VPAVKKREETQPAAWPVTVGEQWYKSYYCEKGIDRNNLRNPQVLFQNLAQEVAVLRALRMIDLDPLTNRVLDVGCGEGASLIVFLRLGLAPANLYGIDFQKSRIDHARRLLPGLNFSWSDATQMDFPDDSFDLVTESTVFVHSVDEDLSTKIAAEMLRVTRTGGHLVLTDWRYSKPGSAAHKATSQSRIGSLFHVGSRTTRRAVFRGPLVPPLGRFLSSRLPSIYFLVQGALPFLVGQVTTVLRKV
jgi:SAM-dependent methyltransferase